MEKEPEWRVLNTFRDGSEEKLMYALKDPNEKIHHFDREYALENFLSEIINYYEMQCKLKDVPIPGKEEESE